MLTLLLLACGGAPQDSGTEPAAATFPEGFLWGTAVAGFQVEAGCPGIDASECTDDASDWYQWVTDPELRADASTHLSGEPIEVAPGHYELYPSDLQLAADLGTNAFRTSIEWSRVFPDGAAEQATTVEELAAYADPVAVAHYRAYFDAIRAAGLDPMVTLTHYTLPLWLHDGKACHTDPQGCEDRGWADLPRIRQAISLYAGWCAMEYGDQIDRWATENEPLAIVIAGYLLPSEERTNPPGVSDPEMAFDVFFNLIEGHAAMYDAVHAHDAVDADGDGAAAAVGLVSNLVAIAPLDEDSELDRQGAEHADYVYNRLFLDGAIRGALDRDLDGVAEEQRADLAGRMDWLGINYYTRITVRGLTVPLIGGYPRFDFYPEVVWEEYPEGLADVVGLGGEYGLPIYITENGAETRDDLGDSFLRPHLSALLGAIEQGADVRGYYYWTLMDNYEWNHGTAWRMGLYGVDPSTKARTLRPAGETYADVIRTGRP